MGPPDKNADRKEAEVKVKTDQGEPQMQHLRKKPAFTTQPKFSRSCRALTCDTFSGYWPNNFKATLENIAIYAGVTYSQDMGVTLKAHKEAIIPQPDGPENNVPKSTKYIWKI